MAHFAKYTATQKGQLLGHYSREHREYSNQNIHHERTGLNYNLAPTRDQRDIDYSNERIEQSQHLTRSNIVHMVDCVVTLPRDYDGQTKEFFEHTYEFLERDFGRDNVISSYVHMDETTPHMHFCFTPITDDNRLCAKEIVDRQYLQHFHDRLQEHLREREPTHTINILSENKQHERDLPIKEYQLREFERTLSAHEKQLNERVVDYNEKAIYINERYEYIDRINDYCHRVDDYCDRNNLTHGLYYTHEFYANRGDREHLPPEQFNPDRTAQEREQIARDLERDRDRDAIEHDHDHDR